MPAPIDTELDRSSVNSHATDAYSPDFFDGLYFCNHWIHIRLLFSVFFFIASVADLADLLKSEPQDDFIVDLQDTISNIFSSPTIFSLAYVWSIQNSRRLLLNHFSSSVMICCFVLFNNQRACVRFQQITYLFWHLFSKILKLLEWQTIMPEN